MGEQPQIKQRLKKPEKFLVLVRIQFLITRKSMVSIVSLELHISQDPYG